MEEAHQLWLKGASRGKFIGPLQNVNRKTCSIYYGTTFNDLGKLGDP